MQLQPLGPDYQLLSIADLARRYQVPASTIRGWRQRGSAPKATKLGRHVRFTVPDVLEWELGRGLTPAPGVLSRHSLGTGETVARQIPAELRARLISARAYLADFRRQDEDYAARGGSLPGYQHVAYRLAADLYQILDYFGMAPEVSQ